MLISKEIDIKSYYRFIEFCSKLLKYNVTHERFKRLAFDDYKAESLDEIKVKQFSNAYLYMLNNANQSFTESFLQDIYYLLTHKQLSKTTSNKILQSHYINYNENIHYHVVLVHLCVLENVKQRKIEFAFIISNYVMLKNNRYPIIPYEGVHKKYKQAIRKNNINMDDLMVIFSQSEAFPNEYKKNNQLTSNTIIETIQHNKQTIIENYHISKLYLYGSFAKENTNPQSDLDILAVFSNDISRLEKAIHTKNLQDFIESKLNIHVDILDFNYALKRLDISEMENIITLI